MNFFNELLNSYDLLKKRKLRIPLNEEGGRSPSFSELSKETENERSMSVISSVINTMKMIFPGAEFSETKISSGQVVSNISKSVESSNLGPENLKLQLGSQEDKKVTEETPDSPCSPGIIWPSYQGGTFGGNIIVNKSCKLNSNVARSYRQALTDFFFAGGDGSEMAGEGRTPQEQYLINSDQGRSLLDIFKDNPEVRSQLIKLMNRGWDNTLEAPEGTAWGNGRPSASFFDPEKKSSIFGLINKTLKEGAERGIKLGTLGDLDIESAVADEEQVLGSVTTMIKSIDIVRNKNKAQDNELRYIRDNLNYVIDEDGNRQLYFNAGGGVGINFTASPGIAPSFLREFEKYNDFLDKKKDDDSEFDAELYKVPIKNRKIDYQHSDAALASNKVITDVSEEIDQIVLLVSQGNHKGAGKIYTKLRDTYGENINKALRIIENLGEEGLVITDEWEAMKEAVSQLNESFGDLEFKKFATKVSSLRADTVKKSGADYIVRVGTGGGREGFKSDQFYLFKDEDKAKKFQGKVKAFNIKDVIESQGLDWKEFQNTWGAKEDETVFIGYDSLKYNTTGRYSMGKQPPISKLSGTLLKELKRGSDNPWVQGMLGVFGSRTHMSSVQSNLKSVDKLFSAFKDLQNSESTTLNSKQVRRELFSTLGGKDNILGITEDDLKILTSGPSDAKEQLESQNIIKHIEDALFFNSIKSGLSSKNSSVREGWKHTVAMFMLRGAYDVNNARDTVINPKTGKTSHKKRNSKIVDSLNSFMDSDNPVDAVEFHNTVARIGSMGLSSKAKNSNVDYNISRSTNENIVMEVTSLDLMNKLLEIQKEVFTHLIKE